MSSDTTFYINHAHLLSKKEKVEHDYWEGNHSDEIHWEKLYNAVNEESPDLKFKKISIVIVWLEYRNQCYNFRELLVKYKIEFCEIE